jgi:hypothetical protein
MERPSPSHLSEEARIYQEIAAQEGLSKDNPVLRWANDWLIRNGFGGLDEQPSPPGPLRRKHEEAIGRWARSQSARRR